MFNIQKNIKNNDGTIDIISITSNDNYKTLDINQKYKLVNNTKSIENKIESTFKNSIFGTDIGIKSAGFTKITILATILAIFTIFTMYLFCRI